MMKIIKESIAGTLESSDIQIIIVSNENAGIEINLKSSVEKQFGKQIRKVITEVLKKMEIQNVKLVAVDKGALDCTIKARVECAVCRACGIKEQYDWEVID